MSITSTAECAYSSSKHLNCSSKVSFFQPCPRYRCHWLSLIFDPPLLTRRNGSAAFKTIRIFALPWGPAGPESYANPEKRKKLYAALDKTLELCDAHDIRVVGGIEESGDVFERGHALSIVDAVGVADIRRQCHFVGDFPHQDSF